MDEEKTFISHLSKNAPQYFADFGEGPAQIDFISKQVRPNSTFYRFNIEMAHQHHRVLIKMIPLNKVTQSATSPQVPEPDRPRLTSKANLVTKSQLEYKMLSTLYASFGRSDDQRFGALHVFDFLPEQRAIVMAEESAPSLRQIFAKTNRFRYPLRRVDLSRIFYNAGAWLRAYHAFPSLEHTQVRHGHRADFINSIRDFTNFLANILPDKQYFQRIETVTAASADHLLPDNLPMGLGHGDYAMRNILIGQHDRVIVFDTLGRWQVPIYEDIAYFLVRLKSASIQAITQGLAFDRRRLAQYEQEFLAGYFGSEAIPYPTIRLFQIQALLDYWSSQVLFLVEVDGKHPPGVLKKLNLALINRFLRTMLNQLLDEVSHKMLTSVSVVRKTV